MENDEKHQTHYTPNILNIYLLNKTQGFSKGIEQIENKILNRYEYWSAIFSELKGVSFLVENGEVRARTVFALNYKKAEKLKSMAAEYGLILGNGYGKWSESTFRIANFPAIKKKEIEQLSHFLKKRLA